MIRRSKIPKDEIFFAAGLGIKLFAPKSGKENAFSILTHTATDQMWEYHLRLIILLKPKHALEFIGTVGPEERLNF